ncbi:MAG: hypothetical protein IPN54_09665 [Bacteroidetes bacterium]|nr:hypothetical protein [Bacteroidota bacterium]
MRLMSPFALLFATFALFANVQIQAQPAKCGTILTPEQVAKEMASPSFGTQKSMFAPTKCFGKTLSITAHIFADSLGNYGITALDITNSLAALNQAFGPICISFQVCNVNYIPNYKYNDFLQPADEAEVISLYSVPKTINIFYARRVERTPGNPVGGYAYFPGGADFIALSKSSLSSITHEMGHFFGLYHTFETQFGSELANGSNCATTGDLVCDTPADPGLGNTPAPDCNLSPYIKDANNEWYVPMIGNTMSYYSSDCECGFTTYQYNKMALNYVNSRFYLW